ncbi:MAG TPA: hypothetical protein VFJ77_09610 [Gaiellaceae bacterium]|nr:hypothetical protein [Gaiellaceae bacterium]
MQRHALAGLFAALALGFAGVAAAAFAGAEGAGRWLIGLAAAAVAAWFASLVLSLVRRRR